MLGRREWNPLTAVYKWKEKIHLCFCSVHSRSPCVLIYFIGGPTLLQIVSSTPTFVSNFNVSQNHFE